MKSLIWRKNLYFLGFISHTLPLEFFKNLKGSPSPRETTLFHKSGGEVKKDILIILRFLLSLLLTSYYGNWSCSYCYSEPERQPEMHSGIVNERSALFTWGLWEHHLPKSQPPAFFAELLKAQTTLSWPGFVVLREEQIGEELLQSSGQGRK